jgi:hypothetical protein
MAAWRSSVPRDECQPVGAEGAIAQARAVLEPRWSDSGDRIPIEEWISEMALRFLAHRQLENTAPKRAETREALHEFSKRAESLLRQLQRLDAIALDALEREKRDWTAAAVHPLSNGEAKRPYQLVLLGNLNMGAESAFAGALQILAASANRAAESISEDKDGYRNSFTSRSGTAHGQLLASCACTLRDLGLNVSGTVPMPSGSDAGALYRLAQAVLWFATSDETQFPKARALRSVAKLFGEITALRSQLEAATGRPEDWAPVMASLREKQELLEKQ